mmetsp:Transcript_3594/g.7787  ORF Transcript_3594/g.7787 Transcript_3594/m.7787 type:complete len:216 (-) Transcript_3594:499-1146(-)
MAKDGDFSSLLQPLSLALHASLEPTHGLGDHGMSRAIDLRLVGDFRVDKLLENVFQSDDTEDNDSVVDGSSLFESILHHLVLLGDNREVGGSFFELFEQIKERCLGSGNERPQKDEFRDGLALELLDMSDQPLDDNTASNIVSRLAPDRNAGMPLAVDVVEKVLVDHVIHFAHENSGLFSHDVFSGLGGHVETSPNNLHLLFAQTTTAGLDLALR